MASTAGQEEAWELIVVQQPVHARLCGFGDKDRRPVDPPPVVKIIYKLHEQLADSERPALEPVLVHATLWSADGLVDCNAAKGPTKSTRILLGSSTGSPERLKGEDGKLADFVCFPDLSIRTEGTFRLKFSLLAIGCQSICRRGGSVVTSVFTQPFTVYAAKQFPGMTKSTALSKLFRVQGMNILIRNSLRVKKHQAKDNNFARKLAAISSADTVAVSAAAPPALSSFNHVTEQSGNLASS